MEGKALVPNHLVRSIRRAFIGAVWGLLYPPNEFAGPEEERKGPTEHRRLYLGRTVSLSFPLPPLIAIRR